MVPDYGDIPFDSIVSTTEDEPDYHIVDTEDDLEITYWELDKNGEPYRNELVVQDYRTNMVLQYIDETSLTPLELPADYDRPVDDDDIYGTDSVDELRFESMDELWSRAKTLDGPLDTRIARIWDEIVEIRRKDTVRDELNVSDDDWRHMVSRQMSDYNKYRHKIIDHKRSNNSSPGSNPGSVLSQWVKNLFS